MARKNNSKADPSAITLRVWVIEQRDKGSDKWDTLYICHEEADIQEYTVAYRCGQLAEERFGHEFRYRAATLTFDETDKCEIFKSE